MDSLKALITLCFLAYVAQAYVEEHSPSVAFVCNRPAMYLSAAGWIKDDSTDCLKDPVDILNYCRKVYPNLDVRNVVESSKKATIEKWCGFGHNKCHHKFLVRPFRCLVGPFQSDALLVPEHCVFDHVHNTKECKSNEEWNHTSLQSCSDRGMDQQSFAILQPCGIDRFNGVEFVCCPEEDDIDQFLHEEFEYYSTTPVAQTTTTTTTELPTEPTTTTSTAPPSTERLNYGEEENKNDIYDKYLHSSSSSYLNEHEYFIKAKGDLEKHHHEKVTKMMKQWAEARQHVQDLRNVDPKGAEKLNKEITARFQKTYQALEQEGIAEKKQLVTLHQQRVQAGLNEKKRHAMEHFMDIITNQEADAALVLKALQHYIKAEQKDRLHSINHYKHLKDAEPAEAEAVRDQTLNHLDLIQARIQQAVDMLDRVPKYEKKIRSQIEDYLATFQPIDNNISDLLVKSPIPEYDSEEEEEEEEEDEYDLEEEDEEDEEETDEDEDDSDETSDDDTEEEEEEEVEDSEESSDSPLPDFQNEDTPSPTPQPEIPLPTRKEYYDEEVMEDEHDYVIHEQPLHGDSFHDDVFEVNSYIKSEAVNTQRKFSAPTLAIAIGSVTVFVVIVVGIIIMRKRAQRVPASHGFVEVDQAASPEEKHVANMQMNGYENPTYRYFEMNGNSSSA